MFKNEKVFKGERDVKYILFKSHKPTPNLVVVFSGIPPIGKNPAYNYVRTLEGYNCNKLFILDDFGCRASYYLAENQDYAIERSVISLINFIAKENGITNILACGSSKGGYASLYYGIKYGFTQIIAASPQYYLGDYLLKRTKSQNIASFIAGGSGEEDCEYLNSIMTKMIRESVHRPDIFIHLGKGEYHYHSHVKPLVKLLVEEDFSFELDLGNYSEHNDVSVHFPPILKERISKTFNYPIIRSLQELPTHNSINRTYVLTTASNQDKFAFYLYKDNERIHFRDYSGDNTFTIKGLETGNYSVKAFAKSPSGMIVAETNKFNVE
ncbi:hypothetical protein [Mesobacillus campisalis]|uniref:hypothetical protein n=1 Tax=Mesobacillus campisalis TaxID=1408103 RepID=UPI00069BFFD7|nr:hypothetical protein [Mesobacillus campisalis]